MKPHSPIPLRLPPRLDMNAYADFVSATLRQGDPERMARQKAIEERIAKPFRIAERHAPVGRPD